MSKERNLFVDLVELRTGHLGRHYFLFLFDGRVSDKQTNQNREYGRISYETPWG